jgi:hypothetical protein
VSGRSDELRRQRELLREHIAWLEREIAAEEGIQASEPFSRQPLAHFSVTASDADRDAEAILEEFRRSSPAIEAQAKRGCILYFSLAVGLLLAVTLAFAFYYMRHRR